MQRALKRSGLPVWYSEGFNPRIYLNFPLALSLGVEGEKEYMDFYTLEVMNCEEITEKLDKCMPEGLHILSAAQPVYLNKEIGFAEYSADLAGDADVLAAAIADYMEQETIEVQKHSKKKGMITVDIKPHLAISDVEKHPKGITVGFRMPAGNELNLNAGIFTDSFAEYCSKREIFAEVGCTKRTNILCKNGEAFA